MICKYCKEITLDDYWKCIRCWMPLKCPNHTCSKELGDYIYKGKRSLMCPARQVCCDAGCNNKNPYCPKRHFCIRKKFLKNKKVDKKTFDTLSIGNEIIFCVNYIHEIETINNVYRSNMSKWDTYGRLDVSGRPSAMAFEGQKIPPKRDDESEFEYKLRQPFFIYNKISEYGDPKLGFREDISLAEYSTNYKLGRRARAAKLMGVATCEERAYTTYRELRGDPRLAEMGLEVSIYVDLKRVHFYAAIELEDKIEQQHYINKGIAPKRVIVDPWVLYAQAVLYEDSYWGINFKDPSKPDPQPYEFRRKKAKRSKHEGENLFKKYEFEKDMQDIQKMRKFRFDRTLKPSIFQSPYVGVTVKKYDDDEEYDTKKSWFNYQLSY